MKICTNNTICSRHTLFLSILFVRECDVNFMFLFFVFFFLVLFANAHFHLINIAFYAIYDGEFWKI